MRRMLEMLVCYIPLHKGLNLNLFLSRHSHVEEESEREEVDELEGAERADAHAQSQLME